MNIYLDIETIPGQRQGLKDEIGKTITHPGSMKKAETIAKWEAEQKPEAAYFVTEGGQRTGILIMNMKDPSQLPSLAEPWFLALNASIEVTPAMTPEDLGKAGKDVERAVQTYG